MKYKCPKCAVSTVFDESCLKSECADGKPSNECRWCSTKLVEIATIERVQTPRINTAGCTKVSNRFTH